MTNSWEREISALFAAARASLEEGATPFQVIDVLEEQIVDGSNQVRQRLLYLHAAHPSVRSQVVAAVIHEPIAGAVSQIDPLAPELPYNNVMDAILEGWRVIHFPDQRAPFDDREIDIVGYEFILEKWEVFHAQP